MRWAPTVPDARRVLFANSGSESNDTAFKLVRYVQQRARAAVEEEDHRAQKGYHGVTVAAASLSRPAGDAPRTSTCRCPACVRVAARTSTAVREGRRVARGLRRPLADELEQTDR
jgi:adenosylmethionine-8-amino-7-oxononanoate aminotransferase